MSAKTFWIYLVILLMVVFFFVPLLIPDEGYTEGGVDVDYSSKIKKSARSLGGSRSYRGGK